jgi:hypothetical protein
LQRRRLVENSFSKNHIASFFNLSLAVEKQMNSFLCCQFEEVIQAVVNETQQSLQNEVDVFAELREWKNRF